MPARCGEVKLRGEGRGYHHLTNAVTHREKGERRYPSLYCNQLWKKGSVRDLILQSGNDKTTWGGGGGITRIQLSTMNYTLGWGGC